MVRQVCRRSCKVRAERLERQERLSKVSSPANVGAYGRRGILAFSIPLAEGQKTERAGSPVGLCPSMFRVLRTEINNFSAPDPRDPVLADYSQVTRSAGLM